jgi:hypothetical protein
MAELPRALLPCKQVLRLTRIQQQREMQLTSAAVVVVDSTPNPSLPDIPLQ